MRLKSKSAASLVLALATQTHAADVVMSEWNAVNDVKWLNSADTPACTGPGGITCGTDADTFFGRVMGNGGDWLELVVVNDHVDMRGWKIQWVAGVGVASADAPPIGNGTDIWWGDGSSAQGEITLSQAAIWADVRAGTIITVIQATTAQGGLDSDTSFDPCAGDWSINANLFDTTLVSASSNIAAELALGDPLHISEDNWWCRIVRQNGDVVIDLVGEGQPSWSGTGVNSREVGKLEADPSSSTTIFANYQDANNSSFGTPNGWKSDAAANFGCKIYQNMEPLRAPVRADTCAPCNSIALNEYNGVSSLNYLGGGTATADVNVPPGVASDSQFGRALGNGGNWIEFVVIEEHLDMRGWKLAWSEATSSGVITLSNAAFWGDLHTGMIVTIIERPTALGGLDTDLSYNSATGDRWVNVNSRDISLVSQTTSTKAGHVSGDFTTSNDNWSIEIRDQSNSVRMARQGEGSPSYNGGKINAEDVCRLRQDLTTNVDASSMFDDSGDSSTFGRANTWKLCPSNAVVTQSFAVLLASGCVAPVSNPSDLNGDGRVDGADLGILLGGWNSAGPTDLNQDGTTNGADLGILLGSWN